MKYAENTLLSETEKNVMLNNHKILCTGSANVKKPQQ